MSLEASEVRYPHSTGVTPRRLGTLNCHLAHMCKQHQDSIHNVKVQGSNVLVYWEKTTYRQQDDTSIPALPTARASLSATWHTLQPTTSPPPAGGGLKQRQAHVARLGHSSSLPRLASGWGPGRGHWTLDFFFFKEVVWIALCLDAIRGQNLIRTYPLDPILMPGSIHSTWAH